MNSFEDIFIWAVLLFSTLYLIKMGWKKFKMLRKAATSTSGCGCSSSGCKPKKVSKD